MYIHPEIVLFSVEEMALLTCIAENMSSSTKVPQDTKKEEFRSQNFFTGKTCFRGGGGRGASLLKFLKRDSHICDFLVAP